MHLNTIMDWINDQTQDIITGLSTVFTTPILNVRSYHFSLSSIATLIISGLVVFLLSRSISAWIKRGLLVKLGLDRGNREAIASVISYLLVGIGFFVILQAAGINLSSLAVLAGFLGIGLGFSLQNLASNFIGGLTLLVEQPVRIGDFIEVDGLLGTVENISIRSTIVRTIDGVCVIVPNLHLVENHIVNWSYRDPKCCLHIPLGVDYGTDPILVTEALLASARTEKNVLSHPSPKVWFKGFGESSLNFELLVWIDQPPESEPIKSALNFRIEHEFRQRGITIPFPQRELHIHNPEALATAFQKTILGEEKNGKVNAPEVRSPDIQRSSPKSSNNWNLRDLLRRVAYFEACTDLELRKLIEYGYRQLFPSGQVVCQEDDPGESFYIILSGSVEVFSRKAEQYIATLHEGEFFGEMSLLMGTPRSATVSTLEDTILFVVDQNDLQQLLTSHRDLADHIAQKLSERQQVLRELGILMEVDLEQTPFIWIRKQINTLFGI